MKKLLFLLILGIGLGTILPAETRTITITNDLNDAVYYLYLAPEGENDWGEDRLGDDIMEIGDSITIDIETDSSETVFSLMAEDEIEKTYRIDGINIQETDNITIDDGDFLPFGGRNPIVRSLTFYNNTGEDIYYLYVSSNNSMYWGDDILGDEILYKGESYTTELPIDGDYPQHDVLAEGESGSSYEILDENLLELDEIYISEEDMSSSREDYDDYYNGYDNYDDYYDDDYDDDYYGDSGADNGESYLEGYKDGFKEAWSEAYKQGFLDAMKESSGD